MIHKQLLTPQVLPKIIHYTWFSTDPFPAKVQQCVASWHCFMPDWEFRLWDAESLKDIDSQWLQECLHARKWAFASDFVRLYALARYGGIYLDTDCEVYRPFDPLLAHRAFIGREWQVHIDGAHTWHYLTSHCMGAEPGHPFILRCLHYYDGRSFVRSTDPSLPDTLRFDQTLLPLIQCRLAMEMGYDPSVCHRGIQSLNDGLTIYPYNYFDCFDRQPHTYARHLALGSWWDAANHITVHKITLTDRLRYRFRQWLRRFMWRRGYILTPKQ